jgi:hypothetical protein
LFVYVVQYHALTRTEYARIFYNRDFWRTLSFRPNTTTLYLGCDFVIPICGYVDTQKMVRTFFLFAAVLLRIQFVKICQIGVFLVQIPGYTQENDHFLSVYSFICIRSTNSPSTCNSYSCVFEHLCEYADAKNHCFPIKNLPKLENERMHTPIPTSNCFASVGHCSSPPPPPCLPLPCCCTLQCGGGGSATA